MRVAIPVLLMLVSSTFAGEDPAVPLEAKEALGVWQNQVDGSYLLHLTPTRASWTDKGTLRFARARYTQNVATLQPLGQPVYWRLEVDAKGVLTLTPLEFSGNTIAQRPDTRPSLWTRLEKLPPELQIQPSALGEAKPLAADKRKKIQDDIGAREKRDQELRKAAKAPAEIRQGEAENAAFIAQLIKEVGWIDATRFGAAVSGAATLMVQRGGDRSVISAMLELAEKDAKAKKVDGQFYAMLYDRYMLDIGQRQRYGTQIGKVSGETVVFWIEDKAQVDAYRQEIGLGPLSEYLKHFEGQNKGKPVRYVDDLKTGAK